MFLPEPKNSGGDWAIAPEGVHRAVCTKVIDLGTQEEIDNFNGGKTVYRRKIQLTWELADELMPDGNYAGQPFTMTKRYTFSTHEKANFRKDLEAWRGKKFTDADFGPGGFNVNKLLGANCQISVLHKNKLDGKVRAEIAAIMPLAKSMAKAEPRIMPFILSLSPEDYEQDLFEGLAERTKETIAKSPEFQELMKTHKPAPPSAKPAEAPPMRQRTETIDLDDEIPF